MILNKLLNFIIAAIIHAIAVKCSCQGPSNMTASYGYMSTLDNIPFPIKSNCTWIINPTDIQPGQSIVIEFLVLGSERACDMTDVLAGQRIDPASLVETVDGQPNQLVPFYKVRVNDSSAVVNARSDSTLGYDGFFMIYYIDGNFPNDPSVTCFGNCSNHGRCVDGRCVCDFGYSNGLCFNDDMLKLYNIYNECNGPEWTQKWNFSEGNTVYTQPGVTPYSPWRVDTFEIANMNINCPNGLPPLPSYSTWLNAANNKLNVMTDIFSSLYMGLKWFDISNCGLSGFLPESFGKITGYERINVANNNLTGDLSIFRRFGSIQTLDLSNNRFEGYVEQDFQYLGQKSISIGGNSIWCTAYIDPPSVNPFNCTRLTLLSVEPSSIIYNPKNTSYVIVKGNNFPKYSNVSCMFGEAKSPSTVLMGSDTIKCAVPANDFAVKELYLMYKGVKISSGDPLYFKYQLPAVVCPQGTFVSAMNASICQPCRPGAVCMGGSNDPIARSGYYQSLNDMSKFTECFNPQACLGGAENACAKGYSGPLCSQCETGYFASNGRNCLKCDSSSYVLVITFVLISLIFIIWALYAAQHVFRFSSTGLLLQFFQVSSLFGAYSVAFTYPEHSISSFLSLSAVAHFNIDMFNFQCVFEWDFYSRATLILVAPLVIPIILALFLVTPTVLYKLRGGEGYEKDWKKHKNAFINSYLLCLSILNIPVFSKSVELFTCTETGGYVHLKTHPYIECYTDRYNSFQPFFLTCAILYGLGIPLLFFLVLFKHRKHLGEEDVKMRYNSIFQAYRTKVWWFQVYKVIWSVLFMLLPIILNNQPDVLLIMGQLMINLQIFVYFYVQPFRFHHCNNIAPILSLGLLASLYAGSYIQWSDQMMQYSTATYVIAILLVVVAVHGIIFEYQHVFKAKLMKKPAIGWILRSRIWQLLFPKYLSTHLESAKYFSAHFMVTKFDKTAEISEEEADEVIDAKVSDTRQTS